MQGRKNNETQRQFSQWSNNILHFIALISLIGSIILLFLSYLFHHRLKDTNDDGYITVAITLLPLIASSVLLFLSSLTYYSLPSLKLLSELKLNRLTKINIFVLCVGWILFSMANAGALTIILASDEIIKMNGPDIERIMLLDRVNTFEAVLYNSCCVTSNSGILEDYYYNYEIADYSQPQEIINCVEFSMRKRLFCSSLPMDPTCVCYNNNEIYNKIDEKIEPSYCDLLFRLPHVSILPLNYTEQHMCGYHDSTAMFNPKLYQIRFSETLQYAFLPFVSISVVLCATLITSGVCGCIILEAKRKVIYKEKIRRMYRQQRLEEYEYTARN